MIDIWSEPDKSGKREGSTRVWYVFLRDQISCENEDCREPPITVRPSQIGVNLKSFVDTEFGYLMVKTRIIENPRRRSSPRLAGSLLLGKQANRNEQPQCESVGDERSSCLTACFRITHVERPLIMAVEGILMRLTIARSSG